MCDELGSQIENSDSSKATDGKSKAKIEHPPIPPADPNQWYNKNKGLFIFEYLLMKKSSARDLGVPEKQ